MKEVPVPSVGEDEVLVQVRAAGLNVADALITSGVPYVLRLFSGLRRPRHTVRGVDLTGTVTEVGGNVKDLRPDDQVFGACSGAMAGGAFAEYACAPRDHLIVA